METILPASPSQATTIDEVITQLDRIISWSKTNNSRMGYFAALYKLMTQAVQLGISNGLFSNGPRMERLDVIFANRYIDAWNAYTAGKPCTNAWCAAFDACTNKNLVVLQHLILGINTHINLDLGIAAAETSPGDAIHDLQQDFEKINDIIADLSQQVQEALSKIWFPLRFIKKISRNREDVVLHFSINAARRAAWANAVALAVANGQGRSNYINLIDNSVTTIAKKVVDPGLLTNLLLWPVRRYEAKNVKRNIEILEEKQPALAV